MLRQREQVDDEPYAEEPAGEQPQNAATDLAHVEVLNAAHGNERKEHERVGDANFFQGATNYLNDPALSFGYAKTPDLKRNMENISGKDLTEFFNDWIYGEGYPMYTIKWNQQSAGSVNVKISQTQSHSSVSFFEAPVPLRLLGTQGEILDIVLDNTSNNQSFQPVVGFTVQNIQFDPDYDLISKFNNVVLGSSEFDIENQFILYPNPTFGEVHIQKPTALEVNVIRVYNALGQVVHKQQFSETMNLSHVANGILFIQLETSNGVINKTIIRK